MSEREYELIKQYFSMGLQHKEILTFLSYLHGIFLSMRTLKRRLRFLNLYRRKNYTDVDDLVTYLADELSKSSQLHHYRWIHMKCLQRNYVVKQEIVRLLLQVLDPEGVEIRRRKRLRRRQYLNKGPNLIWHLDTYDKLKSYGISINGCIDEFSRHIIWMQAGMTSNDPKVIGGYYLNTLRQLNGCPHTLRADFGTENGIVETMQTFLRHNNDDSESTAFIYGKSTANQRIESWWSILRKHNSQFWINLFQTLKDENHFNGYFLDKSLIQFCFMEIIQNELDQVCFEWNTHRLRSSRNSISPTGKPIVMYHIPEVYRTKDYLIEINNQEDLDECERLCINLDYTYL